MWRWLLRQKNGLCDIAHRPPLSTMPECDITFVSIRISSSRLFPSGAPLRTLGHSVECLLCLFFSFFSVYYLKVERPIFGKCTKCKVATRLLLRLAMG